MAYSLVATIGCIFLFFFAQNLEMLLAAKILIGVPLGGAYAQSSSDQPPS